ncbi:MAG: CRISPR system precrRNA processing endoribonuclease RAMP protein Cas6 [Acidobacteriota bacterium]
MDLPGLTRCLKVGLFRFVLEPCQPLMVPAYSKGNMLRGGFGHAFRRLCCIPQCRDTHSCPLTATCPYKAVFEPAPPPGADRLSKNQDVPRPFVFRPPRDERTRYEPGSVFEFDLVLLGRALDYLPYFVLAFRELGTEGLGLNRARCLLQSVHSLMWTLGSHTWQPGRRVFASEDQLFRSAELLETKQWLEDRLGEWADPAKNGKPHMAVLAQEPNQGRGPAAADSGTDLSGGRQPGNPDLLTAGTSNHGNLQLRFLTPVLLKSEGAVVRRPEFHPLFKRLRDRLNALCTFFGEGPLEADFQGLGRRAEQVRLVSARIEWEERERRSSKTGQRHPLSGFVGQATYEGEFTEFLPWLALGELTHVGKHTAWGNGQIGVGS